MIRFLEGNDWNEDKAYKNIMDYICNIFLFTFYYNKDTNMFIYQVYRKNTKPLSIKTAQIEDELSCGKMYYHGRNKKGFPCLVATPANHSPKKRSIQETFKFVVFIAEQGKYLMHPHLDKFCVILDCRGFNVSHIDVKVVRKLATLGLYHFNWIKDDLL